LYLSSADSAKKFVLQIEYSWKGFKVGISGYAHLRTISLDKWATSKVYTTFNKNLKLLLENALKLNFEAL